MERIRKIAENNVVVETVYFDEEVNGKEVVVHTESYGQSRIDAEVAAAEAKKIELDNLNIEEEKAKEDAKLTELGLIQIERDK